MTTPTELDLSSILAGMEKHCYDPPPPADGSPALRDCDLVMKGGVTSGVVYPLAVLELAKLYRFHSIVGTSAGAIAAAVTAAAEYGRASGGFKRMIDMFTKFRSAGFIANLFQPAAALRPLMQILLIVLKATSRTPTSRAGRSKLHTYSGMVWDIGRVLIDLTRPPWHIPGYLGGIIGVLFGAFLGGGWFAAALAANDPSAAFGSALLGVLIIGLLWWVGVMLGALIQIVWVEIVRNGFGLCTGMPEPNHDKHRIIATADSPSPALTNWLAAIIDTIAGIETGPLTFGDLARNHYPHVEPDHKITLNMVTTDLNQERPYILPFTDHLFLFSEEEWSRIFPKSVVQHLICHAYISQTFKSICTITDEQGMQHTLRFLPDADKLPVIVATRLSLSFPLLLSAVPLWTISAETYVSPAFAERPPNKLFTLTREHVRRNWFSDGGICRNFPIHFFDRLFPRYPTFGINLSDLPDDTYTPDYQMHEKFGEATEATHSSITQTDAFDDKHGIVFPSSYPQERPGSLCKPFDANVIGFLSAILNTGLFYHDNLQSQLPGYYDRVVTILLSSTEGGLNLDMTPETIEQIAIKGYWAGDAVVKRFNLAHHQWVRLRVLLNELEQQLIPLHESLQKHKGLADAADLDTLLNTIGTFLKRHQLDINIVQHLIETEISAYSTEGQRFPYAHDTHWRNAALPRLYLLLLLIEAWGGDETARFQLTHPTLPRDKVQDTDHMRLRVTPDL